MEEWKTYRIGDICNTNTLQYSKKDVWDEFLYLDTGNITRNIIDNVVRYSRISELPSRARRKVISDDIIFSTVRPNQCHFGILNNPPANLLVSTGFAVITVNKKIVDPYYLYYYLTQDSIVDYLHSIGEQAVSAYPSIKPQDIEDLEIELPDLSTQSRIANTLRTLDYKIQLNNRINHNLEQQAQALYKSWFVDFEPFKGGKFVDSELGLIPEGWEVKPLGTICQIEKQTINPQKQPSCSFCHYSIPAYDNSEQPEIQKGSDILSNKFLIEDEMILFSKLNPRIKRIWNVYKSEINSICSTEFVVYKSIVRELYPFVYSVIAGDEFYNSIMSKVNGATGSHQRFHPEETLDFLVSYHDNTIRLFGHLLLPIIQQVAENKKENHYLVTLRDSLLPKLISGELRINDLTC